MQLTLPEDLLIAFGKFVEARIGLHLPEGRLLDTERGVRAAAAEMGWTDVEKFARHLLDAPDCQELVDLLAAHLTIGETYFYRDPRAFEVLEKDVLPEVMRTITEQGRPKKLRIWSAACCSGEEPYSIAMSVHRVLGARPDWKVSIMGTDLNPRFLRKAREGIYGPWSFRTLPEEMRERYFLKRANDRWEVDECIKRYVTFASLNFVDDVFPSLKNETEALDIIFCRNVLMYFSRETAGLIIDKLRACLNEGGWLFTSATDAPRELFKGLERYEADGTMVYRRREESPMQNVITLPLVPLTLPPLPPAPPVPLSVVELPELSVVDPLPRKSAIDAPASTQSDSLQKARKCADRGRFEESLNAVDEAIQEDKLNAVSHYLRGVILHEMNREAEATVSLNRALYLDPNFVIAHITLGNVMRRCAKDRVASRCFENARNLLNRLERDAVLPESGGMTAGRLLHMISTPQAAAA